MTITAFIGRQGSGKTLEMTWIGIHLALKYGKRFACNYALDLDYLIYFSRAIGSRNLLTMINSGDIICCPGSIDYLLAIPDSVVAIDEIAIYLGDSVESPQKIKYLISRFNQCRRRGIELLYVAHSLSRVQKFLRDVTNVVCYCDGKVIRTKNGDIHLKSERYYYFDLENFEMWVDSPKRFKFLFGEWFTKSQAFHIHKSSLCCFKRDFFKAFDSFSDITNDANSSFLLKYKKIEFPGNKVSNPEMKDDVMYARNIKVKGNLITSVLLLIKEILKIFVPNLRLKPGERDYIRAYEYFELRKLRRPWEYSSPIDSKMCKITPRDGLEIFVSFSDQQYVNLLTASSVIKIWLYWKLPAGLEMLAEKVSYILGMGWSVPSDSALLKYKRPPKI